MKGVNDTLRELVEALEAEVERLREWHDAFDGDISAAKTICEKWEAAEARAEKAEAEVERLRAVQFKAWGGYINGQLHIVATNDEDSLWYRSPAIFMDKRAARKRYKDVRQVVIYAALEGKDDG